MEIGEGGLAHVRFQYYEKAHEKNCQDATLDLNPNFNLNPINPNPDHIRNFFPKKIRRSCFC